jgi:adenosylcobinamide-GDP ribazoletransferase
MTAFSIPRGALASIMFLTRVPVGNVRFTAADWRWAPAWMPATGAVIGLVLYAVWALAQPLGAFPAVVLAYAAGLLVTGALHEDGLADTADALGGARNPDDVFRILKDSRIGTYGALALCISLLLRVALISQADVQVLLLFVVSQAISRLPPVWLMVLLPYVTPKDTARSSALMSIGWPQVAWASGLAAVVLAWVSVVAGRDAAGLVLGGTTIVAAACGHLFRARLGGVTGDFLGATQQVTEIVVLMVLVHTGS